MPQWQRLFHSLADGPFSSAPLAARELADGTVLVVTQTFQTIHYNHDGTIVSAHQLELNSPDARVRESGPSGTVNAKAVIDGFGRVVLSFVALLNYNPIDTGIVETVKFDGLTGEKLWPAPAFYNAKLAEYPTNVFVDRSGDVIVTGVASGNAKQFTLKYAGQNGSVLWGPVIIENAAFPTRDMAASVDTFGNVYVSVPTTDSGGVVTVKYDGGSGATLWGPIVFPDLSARPQASLVEPDGNYVLTAATDQSFVALKYDSGSGALIWGPSVFATPPGSSNASVEALTPTTTGDLFLTGFYDPIEPGVKIVSRKLSGTTGAAIWTGTPTDVEPIITAPAASAVAANGDLVVVAVTGTPADPRLAFWRYRGADGETVWGPTEFGGFAGSDPPAFFVGSNGRVFTSELVLKSDGTNALDSGEIDAVTGVPAWGPTEAQFSRQFVTEFVDLAAGPDGNPVAVGRAQGQAAIVTLKYDRTMGSLLWGPITYSPTGSYSLPQQVVVDSSNDAYVLNTEITDGGNGFDVFVIKYSGATGAVLWGPTKFDTLSQAIRLALDPAGNVVVLAWSPDLVTFFTHPALAKLSGSTGAVLWGPVVFDAAGETKNAFDLALDGSGNPVVAGWGSEWFVYKSSHTDGSLSWGPELLSNSYAYAVAVDPAGDVVVTGQDLTYTMNTVKYSGATGSVLWGPETIATAEGDDVAIASNGDAVVFGQFVDSLGNSDFLTIRYKSADGSVVWGPVRADGDGHGYDIPGVRALGFDAAGNVVLGGYSTRPNGNFDISLSKYEGSTGATLWGPVYVGGPDTEKISGFQVQGNSIAVGATSEAGMLTAVLDESLGIEFSLPNLPPAFCGQPYSVPFVAQNGSPAYTWSIVSGSLPDGLTLSSGGSLAGSPTEQGAFSFTVRVTDSTLTQSERAFALVVTEDPGDVAILALPAPSCHYTLAVPPGFASYLWLPGGETTTTIDVAPVERTTYGVIVGDGSGCLLHLSVTLGGTALQDPSCLAPSIASISPTSGPGSGGTAITIQGAKFETGAEIVIAAQDVPGTVVDPAHITTTSPPIPPGTLGSLLVRNPDTGSAFLPGAFFADFLDVPPENIFHDSIETLVRSGVTVGCGSGNFCVDRDTTRAQMAVFLLRSLLGPTYVPPLPTGKVFADVPIDAFAAAWIEDLYARGITGGCLTDPLRYCPDANVSRAEMAVFLLKTELGNAYVPPPATGTVFADVAADAFAAAWIEDLYHRGITAGCLTDPLRYCPDSPVRRDEMAAFLVRTFGL
ncbi:MAG TPA: IPT/TIG domain-containing protein [Thermoanaerobaculia bacterium]